MDAKDRRSDATKVRLDVGRINELLAEKKISGPTAAAELFGIHRSAFARQMGHEVLPSLPVALRMAHRLGVRVEDLVDDGVA